MPAAIRQVLLCGATLLALVLGVARAAEDQALRPLTDADFRTHAPAKITLGRMLFFDKALSGNRNVACSSCHDPASASGDGMSLGVGEGGDGVGATRRLYSATDSVRHRVPRNAPPLFNLGARAFETLLWDGRVALDPAAPQGFDTPAHDDLVAGLDSIVAAQALFPITSAIEMAGEAHENDIGAASARSPALGWREIEARVREIPGYLPLFAAAYSHVSAPGDIRIADVANAIAAFIDEEWRADDSAFDRYLRGDETALSGEERRGMALFYGDAGCARCHAGVLQTDNGFHAIAMPQIGPGKMAGMSTLTSDFGRMAITGARADAYRFRTPSLRNVAATGPYGHSGAYTRLEDVVRHHLDPKAAFERYDIALARLPSSPELNARDRVTLGDERERRAILRATALAPRALGDADVAAILAFLGALTDAASLAGRHGPPEAVPSGLPVD